MQCLRVLEINGILLFPRKYIGIFLIAKSNYNYYHVFVTNETHNLDCLYVKLNLNFILTCKYFFETFCETDISQHFAVNQCKVLN